MENILPDVAGAPENISELTGVAHQPLLPAPQKSTDLSAVDSECTELVPLFRSTAGLDEDPGTPSLPEHLRQIPFRVELRVPLSRFTVRDLQELKPGVLLATEHLSVRDLVLTAAGERLLLVELEAMEQQLAARVKRLAWRHKWKRKA
ncbi:MAG: FliM/FliN family flagellar motor switch protein [Acidobacteriaceae bacterium]